MATGTLRRCTCALSAVCWAVTPSLPAEDLDEDGLDDEVEAMLIERHRPWLLFDNNEDLWPSSVVWFIQRSELVGHGTTYFTEAQLAANPRLVLTAVSSSQGSSSGEFNPNNTDFHIDINSNYRAGQGPMPVGMYAHVTRLRDDVVLPRLTRPCSPGRPFACYLTTALGMNAGDIVLQYWQFFPYNDSQFYSCCEWYCGGFPCDPGDHEGDWLYLDLYISNEPPDFPLRYVVYHHHGDSSCPPSVLPWAGPLPEDGVPRCYIEEGAHEWWPEPGDSSSVIFDCAEIAPHHGQHPNSYQADNVINLGERFAPMPNLEAELVVLFNGHWGDYTGDVEGDNPAGPIFQYWPLPPLHVAHVDASFRSVAHDGAGSRYYPFQTIGGAVDAVESGGVVSPKAGSYREAITITKRLDIIATSGPVTIGQ